MDKTWGRKEVLAYLEKMHKHFNVSRTTRFTAQEYVDLLEAYDEIDPVTPEQLQAISTYFVGAVNSIAARRN